MTHQRLRQLAAEDLPLRLAATPRQQRGRDRQQALLEAGLRLSATRHWADVTVGDIAAAIGCSVGTFYTRFHTKAAYFDVLLTLVAEVLQQRVDAFLGAPRRATEAPHEFITRWVELVVRSFCIHRGLVAAALLEMQPTPLSHLRRRTGDQFAAAIGRHAGWDTAVARRRLSFAHQMLHAVLVNAVLSDPGPLLLDEPALCRELAVALNRYLAQD